MENLSIGAVNWTHAKWQGGYYPDDMPTEWQLDFYSNQFNSVLLPIDDFLLIEVEDCEEIVECLEGEAFSIYVYYNREVEASSEILALIQKQINRLEGFVKGMLVNAAVNNKALSELCHGADLTITQRGRREEFLASPEKQHWEWQVDTESDEVFWGEPLALVCQVPTSQAEQIDLLNRYGSSYGEIGLGAPIFFGDAEAHFYSDANALIKLQLVGEFLGL